MNDLLMLATEASEPGKYVRFDVPGWVWAAFVAGIAILLIADLLLVHRTPHVISVREALIESAVWITLGLGFSLVIAWWQGGAAAGEYLSGYLIEKSLSIDNVFVWSVILTYFAVPPKFQFRVLFWGVFGALLLRAAFIFAGVALIETFDWVLYVFGALLLYTAWKVARHEELEVHPENNTVLRYVRKVIPSSKDYDGQKMLTVVDGRRVATPLLAVLVLIETTDVLFAVDSVPAILAVSREPFIVFSSNAFAILGLRALYFALRGMQDRFRYLNVGLGIILGFVGVKMLLANIMHIDTAISLAVIGVVITITIVASLAAEPDGEDADETEDARDVASPPTPPR